MLLIRGLSSLATAAHFCSAIFAFHREGIAYLKSKGLLDEASLLCLQSI